MRYVVALTIVGVLTGCAHQSVTPVNSFQSTELTSMKAQENKQLIENFYQAFQQHKGEKMASYYAADARFSDPVFSDLRGQQVGDMWRMLTERAQDFSLVYDGVQANEETGEAHWVASYMFSKTGRKVVNNVHSKFTFKDGKIVSQHDSFDLWHWSSQALGIKGRLLGWTPLVQHKIQQQAADALAIYQKNKGQGK